MARIKENPLFKSLIDTSYDVGKAVSPRSVNINKFQNITPAIQNASLEKLGTTTVPYGGSTKYEKFHPGIDIANKIGTPIPSYTPGRVLEVVTGKKQGDKGYGNYVTVEDPQKGVIRYSHLNQSFVKPGQILRPGQVLGTLGNTGSTYSLTGGTGAHLDLRILNAAKQYVDPRIYLRNYAKL